MPDSTPVENEPEETLGFDPKPIVVSMGMVIGNHLQRRWLSESDAREAVDECCELLDEVFKDCGEITFGVFENVLKVNDVEVETAGTTAAVLVSQMEALEARNLTLSRGLSSKTFANLLEIMSAHSDELEQLGGFSSFVADQNFEHVTIRHITYRQVTEEEVVVRKAALDKGASIAESGSNVREDVMAYLKGGATDEEQALAALDSAVSDSAGMAELIIEAARETDDGASDRVSANSVVTALRRAFDGWMKSSGLKTQKGKKALGKSLAGIEESVRDLLKEAGVDVDEESDVLADAVEGMLDELRMDALAAENLKKRKAIETSEKRILRYIRNRGRDGVVGSDLERKLHEGGLGGSNWRELLVRSGVAGTGGENVENAAAVAALSSKLSVIESDLQRSGKGAGKEDAGELTNALKSVAVDVDALVTNTNRKIQDIIEEYKAEESAAGEEAGAVGVAQEAQGRKRMSRKQLYEHLAEIGQEICQPLSVINCSLSMITSGRLGGISNSQEDMLKLAAENTEKLKSLADNLMEVTGVPDALEPNSGIRAQIYDG